MTEKKRILQPVNLIVFLIFALAIEAEVSLPLFEGANMFLQIGWTCYLLVGMVFLFFVGEKVARAKVVEKYLLESKVGRFLTGCFLFFICIGAGAAFRIWETVEGSGFISKNFSFNLAYYLIIGAVAYFTAKLISGFKGTTAAVILMALCPFFDFSAKLPVRECIYTLLVLAAIFFISLANYFVEKKSVSLQDTLLTILGAVSLAGATFLHISALVLIFPCIFLLIRRSGVAMRGKREQRGLRSLLFEVFYICSLVVIFLIYNVEQHAQIVDIPIDYNLFHVIGSIGKEPMHVLEAVIDKFSKLFAINNPGEYYNGLLMGMLLLGMIGAILLFKKKTERKFFPIYLFNWYFCFGILLKESAYNGLVLYALLAYMTAGTMEDLSELVFAGKRKGQDELAEEEKKEIQEDFVAEEQIEEQASEKKLEMDAALKEAEKKLPKPEEKEAVPEPKEVEAEAEEPEEKEATPEPKEVEAEAEEPEEKEAAPKPKEVEAEAEEPEEEEKSEEKVVAPEPEEAEAEKPEEKKAAPELKEVEAEEPEEKAIVPEPEAEPEIVQEASEKEPETLPEPEPEIVSEPESETLPEPEIVSEPEPETLPEPEAVTEVIEPEPEKVPVSLAKPEPKKVPVSLALENPLEKQMDEMIKREGRIMEIVEKQNTRIAKLEEELREQRIRTKNMERHYRKELAISRNKKR